LSVNAVLSKCTPLDKSASEPTHSPSKNNLFLFVIFLASSEGQKRRFLLLKGR
jgi:hypothetical protein